MSTGAATSKGFWRYDGPMMNGVMADVGPVALLRVEGRAGRSGQQKGADAGSQCVPHGGCDARCDANLDQQELDAFPRGLQAHRPRGAGFEGARTDAADPADHGRDAGLWHSSEVDGSAPIDVISSTSRGPQILLQPTQ